MKPSFQHLGFDSFDGSFLCYWVKSKKFGFHWHYHPECEISYVVKGYGTRLVGDHVEEFSAGDLVFLGSDLPHTWISDDLFNQSGQEMEVVVVQFPKELIERRAIEIPELSTILSLMNRSNRGLYFSKNQIEEVGKKLVKLTELKGFMQYHLLLEILNDLGMMKAELLASEFYTPNRSSVSESRISKVCSYIHEGFSDTIEIAELADLANMNEAAFCRFFKKMTGKTAITYINDLRIGKACQLLLQESNNIDEVAFQSGYNSITHFNRSFLKRKGQTPSNYRKNYIRRTSNL